MHDDEREMLLEQEPEELVRIIEELAEELTCQLRLPPALEEQYGHLDRRELARRLEICERAHNYWIVMAVKAAMGRVNIDRMTVYALGCIVGEIPPVEASKAELEALIAELEQQDTLEARHGPLRSIVIDS